MHNDETALKITHGRYTIKCSVTHTIQQMMLNEEEKVEWRRGKKYRNK